jgi:hypothetical protein
MNNNFDEIIRQVLQQNVQPVGDVIPFVPAPIMQDNGSRQVDPTDPEGNSYYMQRGPLHRKGFHPFPLFAPDSGTPANEAKLGTTILRG